jgi:hypothetical protein
LGIKRGLLVFGLFNKRKVEKCPAPHEEEFEKRQGKHANVKAVQQALIVVSNSGRGLLQSDPEAFHCFLPPNADNDTLGKAVISALAASRFLSSEEADKFLNSSEASLETWVSKMLTATGIKTRQKLFQRMASCSLIARDGKIKFSPTVKRRGAAWEGRGTKFESTISQDSSSQAVGAALREALRQCLPAVVNAAQQSATADRRDDAAPAER